MTDAEAEERFRALLRAAVERRLVADVPLGAFLSGGLDSSTVVALMAEAAGGRVKTFTIGFAGHTEYDEREHARVVAERFSTEHTEFVVEPKALDLVDRLVWHHDGPFGDSSAVPTYLLSELTRTKVTVALNGDGGDEVFAGYLRLYGGALSERVPRAAFRAAAGLLGLLPEPADRKHPLRFAKRFAEAGSLPLLERYLRWNAYFTADLPALLKPELAARSRPRAAARELPRELRRGGGLDARAPPPAQLRDVPPRRPPREDGPHVDGPRARGPLALPRHGGRGVRRVAARPAADALRQGEGPPAPGDEGDPAGLDPDAGEDGLRRPARGLVPERPRRLRARAAARPGEPDLRVPAARARGRAARRATGPRPPTCPPRSGRCSRSRAGCGRRGAGGRDDSPARAPGRDSSGRKTDPRGVPAGRQELGPRRDPRRRRDRPRRALLEKALQSILPPRTRTTSTPRARDGPADLARRRARPRRRVRGRAGAVAGRGRSAAMGRRRRRAGRRPRLRADEDGRRACCSRARCGC